MARFRVEMPLEGVVRLMVEIPDDECLDGEGYPFRGVILKEAEAVVSRLLLLTLTIEDPVLEYELHPAWDMRTSTCFEATIEQDDVPEAL